MTPDQAPEPLPDALPDAERDRIDALANVLAPHLPVGDDTVAPLAATLARVALAHVDTMEPRPTALPAAMTGPLDRDGLTPAASTMAAALWDRWRNPNPAIPTVLLDEDPRTVAQVALRALTASLTEGTPDQ